MTHDDSSLTRRQVLAGAGGTGLLAAAGPVSVLGSARPARAASAGSAADGTPEQIHLTWGADPASSVTVSWASPGPAGRGERAVVKDAANGCAPASLSAVTAYWYVRPGASPVISAWTRPTGCAWLRSSPSPTGRCRPRPWACLPGGR